MPEYNNTQIVYSVFSDSTTACTISFNDLTNNLCRDNSTISFNDLMNNLCRDNNGSCFYYSDYYSGTTANAQPPRQLEHSSVAYELHEQVPEAGAVVDEILQEVVRYGLHVSENPVESASDRARELLNEFLTDEQRRIYDKKQYIEVVTPSGRSYHLHRSYMRNILEYNAGGDVINIICGHIAETECPVEDNLLAQLFHLTFNEDEFRRIANIVPII